MRGGEQRAGRAPMAALTGVPGTGKSSVARCLGPAWAPIEVAELARRTGAVSRRGRASVTVDMGRLAAEVRRPGGPGRLLVGHLAHLLPVGDIVVLRCHPIELERRLARARRGTPRERRDNAIAEATDVVLVEALAARHRLWEIDTTGRTPRSVARAVAARLRRRGPSEFGRIDWLADPRVTEHILRPLG